MEVLLHVRFVDPVDGDQGFARLEVADLPFAPFAGFEFEHPVWHSAKRVASVSWNIADESFMLPSKRKMLRLPMLQVTNRCMPSMAGQSMADGTW